MRSDVRDLEELAGVGLRLVPVRYADGFVPEEDWRYQRVLCRGSRLLRYRF